MSAFPEEFHEFWNQAMTLADKLRLTDQEKQFAEEQSLRLVATALEAYRNAGGESSGFRQIAWAAALARALAIAQSMHVLNESPDKPLD